MCKTWRPYHTSQAWTLERAGPISLLEGGLWIEMEMQPLFTLGRLHEELRPFRFPITSGQLGYQVSYLYLQNLRGDGVFKAF